MRARPASPRVASRNRGESRRHHRWAAATEAAVHGAHGCGAEGTVQRSLEAPCSVSLQHPTAKSFTLYSVSHPAPCSASLAASYSEVAQHLRREFRDIIVGECE